MAKPIFLVGLPGILSVKNIRNAYEATAQMSVAEEYHIIIYPIGSAAEQPVFKVFYEKDFDEKSFEEIKAEVIRLTEEALSEGTTEEEVKEAA